MDAGDPLARALGQLVVLGLHPASARPARRGRRRDSGSRPARARAGRTPPSRRAGCASRSPSGTKPIPPASSSRQIPVFGACVSSSTSSPISLRMSWLQTSTFDASRPAAVDVADVDLVVDVHVLEQVEQEQRHVGVGAGGHVRHRRHAADPRVDLAQVDLAGVDVGEVVDLEEAAVALHRQPVAELLREHAGAIAVLGATAPRGRCRCRTSRPCAASAPGGR